jgi:hypothetical protein
MIGLFCHILARLVLLLPAGFVVTLGICLIVRRKRTFAQLVWRAILLDLAIILPILIALALWMTWFLVNNVPAPD